MGAALSSAPAAGSPYWDHWRAETRGASPGKDLASASTEPRVCSAHRGGGSHPLFAVPARIPPRNGDAMPENGRGQLPPSSHACCGTYPCDPGPIRDIFLRSPTGPPHSGMRFGPPPAGSLDPGESWLRLRPPRVPATALPREPLDAREFVPFEPSPSRANAREGIRARSLHRMSLGDAYVACVA